MNGKNDELTLGQLGKVFKKSLKRAAIYLLASLLVAGAILFSARAITSVPSYSTAITYSAANENSLERLKQYKSTAVSNALKTAGIGVENADEAVKNLTVSAETPKEIAGGETFVPKTFTLSLKKSGKLKLTGSEYKNLLDEIANEYKKAFAASFFPSISFGSYDENSSSEYFALADELNESVKGAYEILSEYITQNPSLAAFVSADGKSSAQTVLNDFSTVAKKLSGLLDEIVISGAEKSEGALKKHLNLSAARATAEAEKYAARYNEANANLAAFMNTIKEIETGADGVTVIKYDNSEFLRLYKEFSEMSRLKNAAEERNAVISGYLANLSETPASAAKTAEISKTLSELFTKSAGIIENYRSLAKEYNETAYLAEEVSVKYPARAINDSPVSVKMMAVLMIAVAIIAYIAAFSKTYGICKRNGFENREISPEKHEEEAELKF